VAVGRIAVPPPTSGDNQSGSDTESRPSASRGITPQPPSSSSSSSASFRIGSKVESKTRGSDRWFAGTVLSQNRDGTYDIRLESGEENRAVITQNMRAVGTATSSSSAANSSYGMDIDEGDYVPPAKNATSVINLSKIDR
jgi:hypothetical protein